MTVLKQSHLPTPFPIPCPATHTSTLFRFYHPLTDTTLYLPSVFYGCRQGMEFITVLVTSPSTLLTSKTQTEPAASRCRQHHFSKTPVPGNHSLQTSLKYTNSPYSAGSDTSQQTQHIKLGIAESSVPVPALNCLPTYTLWTGQMAFVSRSFESLSLLIIWIPLF